MIAHDLARDAQSYARALFLGGIEGDEDLLLTAHGDGSAIVGHTNDHFIVLPHLSTDVYVFGPCLQGILYEVDENLRYLSLIGKYHKVGLCWVVAAGGLARSQELAVERHHLIYKFLQV